MPDPSSPSRWLHVLAAPFVRIGRWFHYAPRPVRVAVALIVLVGLAAGGYFGSTYLKKRATTREVAAGWREFEHAANKTDLPGMHAALDRVLAANPTNPAATRRKAALAAESADPDDPA